MDTYKIAVIVGSLRRDSINRKLAGALMQLAPPEFSCTQIEIGDQPLYNQDNDDNPAAAVVRLKNDIKAAAGLLFHLGNRARLRDDNLRVVSESPGFS